MPFGQGDDDGDKKPREKFLAFKLGNIVLSQHLLTTLYFVSTTFQEKFFCRLCNTTIGRGHSFLSVMCSVHAFQNLVLIIKLFLIQYTYLELLTY